VPLLTSRPRGTIDVLPRDIAKWHHLEAAVRDVCDRFGYAEIRTPLIEHAELYLRTTGETTDLLEKETYTFVDRGGRTLTMRPEGTPGVARAFLENGLQNEPLPAKFYYLGPMFRYDRPQAGRYRQHTQFGVEVFGAAGPEADLEVMLLAITFLRELGLDSLAVHLNSIGCPACRPAYREALVAHYRERQDQLCRDCQRRLERNPLRLLDCKEEQCQPHKLAAPSSVDHLCPDCAAHFSQLQSLLRRFDISYEIDPTLVRGLDYYTRTIFEIMYSGLGAQGTVCGGGRYDGLIEAVGGPALPGVGYGMGLERVLLTLEKENRPLPPARGIEIFLAVAGSPTDSDLGGRVQELLYALRWAGVAAEADAMGRSLRQQLRYADRSGAKLVAVIGQDEVLSGTVKIKEMATGREVSAGLADLAATVKAMLTTG